MKSSLHVSTGPLNEKNIGVAETCMPMAENTF